MAKKNIPLQPENFELETNTVWTFPDRGKWATHDAKYRGNWSPYIPRNVILRYSNESDTVLDQFVGGGTTAVEAKLTKCFFISNLPAVKRLLRINKSSARRYYIEIRKLSLLN